MPQPDIQKLEISTYICRVTESGNKNFGIDSATFSTLVEKLKAGDQSLFEHVFLVHFKDCMAYLVREDNATESTAYDATMDAFLSFREGLVSGKIKHGNLRFLLTRMARQHYFKSAKKTAAADLDELKDFAVAPDVKFAPSAAELLETGWKRLGAECKELLRAFYFQKLSFKEIATMTQRPSAALRKQKQRCVEKLRLQLTK